MARQGAALIFTAGTSGPSKGVLLSHRTVLTQIGHDASLLGQRPRRRAARLPADAAFHGTRARNLPGALYAHGQQLRRERRQRRRKSARGDAERVLARRRASGSSIYAAITVAAAEATFLQRALFNWAIGGGFGASLILRNVRRRFGLDRVRIGCIGGAPVSPALIRWYRALGIDLVEFYGLSEAAGLTMATQADPVQRGKTRQVVSGGELKISPTGELLVRDENIFTGYWRAGRPSGAIDRTAAGFPPAIPHASKTG